MTENKKIDKQIQDICLYLSRNRWWLSIRCYSIGQCIVKLCIPWYISDLVNLTEVSVQSKQNGFIMEIFTIPCQQIGLIVYIVSYPWKYEVPQLGPQHKLSKETT